MTWLLIAYAEFVVMRVILSPSPYLIYKAINMIIFNLLAFLAISSHMKSMFSDPGAVPKGNATKENIQMMGFREGEVIFKCPKCCSIKPGLDNRKCVWDMIQLANLIHFTDRAHHCSVCRRCVLKMDHHWWVEIVAQCLVQHWTYKSDLRFSPWINNCVGERNQKFFVLFCCYIALISIHALFMSVNQFAMCIKHEWKECSSFSPPATVILLLFLTFEGLLFAIFTIIMLGTQLNAIWTDETGIEQLKKEERKWVKKSKWRAIESVFGKFSIFWLSPFSQPKLKKKIEGCLYPV